MNNSLTYEDLVDKLANHMWADPKMSHGQYWRAMKEEQKLFKLAQSLGGRGVELYRTYHDGHIDQLRAHSYRNGMNVQREADMLISDILRKKLKECRDKYMTPLDHFKEKLDNHDWYYEFSDDITVYRAGKANELSLEKEAKEGGPEFVQALSEAMAQRSNNIRKGTQ